jgi:hypothetical protein
MYPKCIWVAADQPDQKLNEMMNRSNARTLAANVTQNSLYLPDHPAMDMYNICLEYKKSV